MNFFPSVTYVTHLDRFHVPFCQARANRPLHLSARRVLGAGRPHFRIFRSSLGAACVHFGGADWMRTTFYGVSPPVIALVVHSCCRFAKLGMDHCSSACGRLLPHDDLAGSRSGGAVHRGRCLDIYYYRSWFRGGGTRISLHPGAPLGIGIPKSPTVGFSPVIVPFLERPRAADQMVEWPRVLRRHISRHADPRRHRSPLAPSRQSKVRGFVKGRAPLR